MWKDYFRISWSSLKKRSLRSWLTMIGIFIGIASVVALISLGQGMKLAINSQFQNIGTDKVIVQGVQAGFGPPGQNAAGSITEDDLKLVRQVSGVKKAAGRLLRSVNVEFGDQKEIMFGVSLPQKPDDRDLILELIDLRMAHGRMLKSNDKGKLIVGYDLWAEEFFNKDLKVGSKMDVNGRNFEVVGLLDKWGAFGSDAIIMNEDDLKKVIGEDEELSAIVAQVDKGEKASEVGDKILRAFRKDRGQKEGFEDVTVQTSEELINSINLIVGVVQAVFIGIAAISLLVGGIGIMNTMYTAVLERTKEIGIMKAIGAKNKDILFMFLAESGLLGLVGGAIGIALGMGLSKLVEFFGRGIVGDLLKASFPWYLILGVLAFSFLIGAVSGVFPARQASRMHPAEALRSE